MNGAVMDFLSVEAFAHALMLLYKQTSEFYLAMALKHKWFCSSRLQLL